MDKRMELLDAIRAIAVKTPENDVEVPDAVVGFGTIDYKAQTCSACKKCILACEPGALDMEDSLNMIGEAGVGDGVMHCFSGNQDDMARCLELGLYISIAGPVTFPRADGLRKIARSVPLDRLLIETDCPYLAPQAVRGRRNEPAHVKYILEEITRARNISGDKVGEQTASLSEKLFDKAYEFDFFQAVRLLERLARSRASAPTDVASIGYEGPPHKEPVRFHAMQTVEVGRRINQLPVGIQDDSLAALLDLCNGLLKRFRTTHRRVGDVVGVIAVVTAVGPAEEPQRIESPLFGQIGQTVQSPVVPHQVAVLLLQDRLE